MTHEAIFYFKQLGLDSASLQRYANLYSVEYDELQSVVSDRLGFILVGAVTEESMKSIM